MGCCDYLKNLLRPMRLYDVDEGYGADELWVEGSFLDGVLAALDDIDREMLIPTAEDTGLARYEELLPYRPSSATLADRRQAVMAQEMAAAELVEPTFGRFEIEGGRRPAEQAERHGTIGGMALSGEGERTVERRADRRGAVARRGLSQQFEEVPRRRHRPHRMRGRRTDADLEDVEYAQEHPRPLSNRFLCGVRIP